MKTFAVIVLSVILAVQSTSAIPRQRRDAEEMPQLSPEGAKSRTELHERLLADLIKVAMVTVENQKKNFVEVVKSASTVEPKTDALKEHLKRFDDMIKRADAIHEPKTEKEVEELFAVFRAGSELANMYNDLDKPTAEEILFKHLLEKKGGTKAVLQFLIDFAKLRDDYEKSIQHYIDSLSEEDKVKEAKFIAWFTKFKAVMDFEHFADVTMEVFRFFDADKKE